MCRAEKYRCFAVGLVTWIAGLWALGCSGEPYQYPAGAKGAAPQERALGFKVNQPALDFASEHMAELLEGAFAAAGIPVLEQTVEDPPRSGHFKRVKIAELPLPEALGEEEVVCRERGWFWQDECDYAFRLRDGCIGPGQRSVADYQHGKACRDLGIGERETYPSTIQIRLDHLSQKISVQLEAPGSGSCRWCPTSCSTSASITSPGSRAPAIWPAA